MSRIRIASRLLIVAAAISAVACSADTPSARTVDSAAGEVALAPGAPAWRLVIEQPGNEARYRVRERLVGKELDNDAVGVTQAVSGELAFDAEGGLIPEGSKITIDVTGLTSDQARRDRYVRERLLETPKFGTVVFEPTAVRGAPKTLPTSGSTSFSLLGNLTVKGVTRPTTWHVQAKFAPAGVTGSASTAFTFAEFTLVQPRVPVLLSVSDTIKLEYDFNMAVKK